MHTTATSPAARALRRTEWANGRSYAVEILAVGPDRWRAFIAGRGTTNAVMPFYGTTPDEASQRLMGWLERVGGTGRDKSGAPGASAKYEVRSTKSSA